MSNVKLKPCPFCGAEMNIEKNIVPKGRWGFDSEVVSYTINHADNKLAIDNKCPIVTRCYDTEKDAIAFWNKRYDNENKSYDIDNPLPCPFCGEDVEVVKDEWEELDGPATYEVYHERWCFGAFDVAFDTEEEAIKHWNERI